jgi:hypothetical protein
MADSRPARLQTNPDPGHDRQCLCRGQVEVPGFEDEDFLVKPFGPDQIFAILLKWLDKNGWGIGLDLFQI